MAIKWGTDSKVTYEDPEYHFPLQIGASGEMTLRVEDSRRLLINVVGTETLLTQQGLTEKFRAFLMNRIKPYLARTMRERRISIFETDEHMGEISEVLHQTLTPDFTAYGLELVRFFITTIVKPDGEKNYERFKELRFRQFGDVADAQIRQQVGVIDQETDARRTVIQAGAVAEKRRVEGYTYQQERSYDVAEKVAENEAVGEYANLGIGLGMIGGVAGGIGGTVAGITGGALGEAGVMGAAVVGQPVPGAPGAATPPGAVAPTPGAAGATSAAAAPTPTAPIPVAPTATPPPTAPIPVAPPPPEPAPTADDLSTFKQRIDKLKALQEAGLLTDEEFAAQKANLLGSI
jgi:hypothetical protein